MSLLLAIDPGSRGCGVALFNIDRRELLRAAYVKGQGPEHGLDAANAIFMAGHVRNWLGFVDRVDVMAVEVPKVYKAEDQKGDQNDLVPLALVVGCVIGLVAPRERVVQYFPRDWKGTIDADAMTDRIVARLRPPHAAGFEIARCERCTPSLAHNMFDAVGIGLKYLERLNKIRTYDAE